MSVRAVVILFAAVATFATSPSTRAQSTQVAQEGRIRGRVIAADTRAPLRQAQVRIVNADVALRRAVTTDAEGRYEVAGLPSGRYLVSASRNGYVTLEFGQRRAFDTGTPVPVESGRTATNIDFALLRGSVIVARMVDEFGDPVPFASVQPLRLRYGLEGRRELAPAGLGFPTDDLGQARLFGLMPGSYIVSATVRPQSGMAGGPVSGEGGYPTTYFPGTANPAEAQSIAVDVGQEVAVQIDLRQARNARIEGTVLSSSGRPATSGAVTLRSPLALPGGAATRAEIGTGGRFVLPSIPPGNHVLYVQGGPSTSATPAEFAAVPVVVAGGETETLTVTLTAGALVRGRVSFEGSPPRTAEEYRRLRVVARPVDPEAIRPDLDAALDGRVEPDGRFAIGGVVGAVTFRVLTGPERTTKSVTFDGDDVMATPMQFSGTERVDGLRVVVTDRMTAIDGHAVNDRGQRVPGYVVVVLPEEPRPGGGGRYTRALRPGQDGGFSVRALPPGRYVFGAVESLEEGQEWDPAVQARIRNRGRAVTLDEGAVLSLELQLIADP